MAAIKGTRGRACAKQVLRVDVSHCELGMLVCGCTPERVRVKSDPRAWTSFSFECDFSAFSRDCSSLAHRVLGSSTQARGGSPFVANRVPRHPQLELLQHRVVRDKVFANAAAAARILPADQKPAADGRSKWQSALIRGGQSNTAPGSIKRTAARPSCRRANDVARM
jgi:hypothetical protein